MHSPQVAAYQAYEKLPEKLLQALSTCTTAIGDYLNDHPQGLDSGLQAFYFDALQFGRVAETFDEHFLFDIHKRELGRQRSLSTLCLRNVVPAAFLRPRLTAARSTVLFSATLSPRHYYADLLGTPGDTVWIDVESPFKAEQLDVQVVSRISTRFAHRQASLEPIVTLMARQFGERPGNYLAFSAASITCSKWPGCSPSGTRTLHSGRNRAAWAKRLGRRLSSGSWNTAKALALRCWAARSARASICQVHA